MESDPDNVTLKVIEALQCLKDDLLNIIVVVGSSNPHYAMLERAIAKSSMPIQLQQNVTNMPELMAWADFAITAGGTTSWELSFMGVPSLMLILADNQTNLFAEGVSKNGSAIYLNHSDISIENILSSIQQLLPFSTRAKMSHNGQRLVDGKGVIRVVQRLTMDGLKVRLATQDDCTLLWEMGQRSNCALKLLFHQIQFHGNNMYNGSKLS